MSDEQNGNTNRTLVPTPTLQPAKHTEWVLLLSGAMLPLEQNSRPAVRFDTPREILPQASPHIRH